MFLVKINVYNINACSDNQQGFLVAQTVKSVMQETKGRSLGQADALEKEMATHSSILAWKIPWTEEPGPVQYWVTKSQT